MEQLISFAMLALAIALLGVLMRMHSRLAALDLQIGGGSVHQIAIPIRLIAAGLTIAVLLKTAQAAELNRTTVFSGLILIPAVAYLNAYLWQFKAVLHGTDLTVMEPDFRTRTYDLTRLVEVHDDPTGTWRLRFQGGGSCWLLKYVSGRNTLRAAIAKAQPYY